MRRAGRSYSCNVQSNTRQGCRSGFTPRSCLFGRLYIVLLMVIQIRHDHDYDDDIRGIPAGHELAEWETQGRGDGESGMPMDLLPRTTTTCEWPAANGRELNEADPMNRC